MFVTRCSPPRSRKYPLMTANSARTGGLYGASCADLPAVILGVWSLFSHKSKITPRCACRRTPQCRNQLHNLDLRQVVFLPHTIVVAVRGILRLQSGVIGG